MVCNRQFSLIIAVLSSYAVNIFPTECLFMLRMKHSSRVFDHDVPDHVTFLNQVTYSGNLVQTELPIEWKPNQITFG